MFHFASFELGPSYLVLAYASVLACCIIKYIPRQQRYCLAQEALQTKQSRCMPHYLAARLGVSTRSS
jgi:hypothetical protein